MRPISRELMANPGVSKDLRSRYEKEIVSLIKKMKPDWLNLTLRAREMLENQRGEEFEKLVHNIFEERFVNPAKRVVKRHVLRTYLSGQAKAKSNLKGIGVGAQVGNLPPDPRVLDILNTRNFTALKGISDDMAKRVKNSLIESAMTGESTEQSAKRIQKATKLPMDRARLIARTETAYAFNTAQVEEYRRYGIEKVEWLTAIDERTCKVSKIVKGGCAGLDGKQFDIDKHPPCPLHPNCRCTLLAVPEEL